jgi:hypothetical protein
MVAFPSKIDFASFLQYAPRGSSAVSGSSRDVAYKVKQDGYVNGVRIIDHSAKRLAEELPNFPFLTSYFNDEVTLVPAPRSSPLVQNALWVPQRLAHAIKARGLAANVLPCLERIQPVQKSATAGPGQRPEPEAHYDSVEVKKQGILFTPKAITIVDDVITRGSTFFGLAKRLEEAFPGVQIRCFALIRTISGADVPTILAPVEGSISLVGGQLSRYP